MLKLIAQDVDCIKKRSHSQPQGMIDTTVKAEPQLEEEANELDRVSLFTDIRSIEVEPDNAHEPEAAPVQTPE